MGMVRMYWNQIELVSTQCLHLFPCMFDTLGKLLVNSGEERVPLAQQSLALALPSVVNWPSHTPKLFAFESLIFAHRLLAIPRMPPKSMVNA